MFSVTIRYGAGDEMTKAFDDGATVRDVLTNTAVKAALGFGDNVRALIDGVEQTSDTELTDGDIITIETRANQKAIEIDEPVLA